MVCPLLDFGDLGDREPRFLPDFRRILLPDLAQLGHCFASQSLDFQPDLEFALVRPELAHPRPGITIDHSAKIKARSETQSVLYSKKRRAAGRPQSDAFRKALVGRD